MEITLNGTTHEIDDGATIANLLLQRDLAATPCAVEVNRQLVPKAKHEQHHLASGDAVEIVTLVGGG